MGESSLLKQLEWRLGLWSDIAGSVARAFDADSSGPFSGASLATSHSTYQPRATHQSCPPSSLVHAPLYYWLSTFIKALPLAPTGNVRRVGTTSSVLPKIHALMHHLYQ